MSWLLTVVLAGCALEPEGSNQICALEDLEEMMEVCADYGGDFLGETSTSAQLACQVGVGDLETIIGFQGVCAIELNASCAVSCDFPDGVQSPD